MNNSLFFSRLFFLLLSMVIMTGWAAAVSTDHSLTASTLITGSLMGLVFAFALVALDLLFRRLNLKTFNTLTLGLLFGGLFGTALLFVLKSAFSAVGLSTTSPSAQLISSCSLLFALYFGITLTMRYSEEFSVSLPFIRFKEKAAKKRDCVIDASILQDSRIIDLAGSGLLDHQLVLPRFVLKEIYALAEGTDESERMRAKRALETVKKLEAVSGLNLRYNDTDFNDLKEPMPKLVKLARMLDANLLTADISQIQISTVEGVRIINIHSLSNALKPLTQAGESISIKIQRFGKEPRQGVGYLTDGTMVVVNGGGEHIGDTVKAQVLSVKHTSSGRMVFCNFIEMIEKGTPSQGGHHPHIGVQQSHEPSHSIRL